MASISEFKAAMIGAGFRPNQFLVQVNFPNFVSNGLLAGQQNQFLCKSASLPGSDLENVQLHYRGRQVNFAGERSFSPWSVSVYTDTSFNIRNALEQWNDGIQNYDTTFGRTAPADYQVDMNVHALDRSGAIIKSYRFYDAWPMSIGAIGLDMDANSAIGQFDVTFQYNYFTSVTGREGGGFGVSIGVNTPFGTFPFQI